jgi:hypothetical protein
MKAMPPELLDRFDWSPPPVALALGRIGLLLLVISLIFGLTLIVRQLIDRLRKST